MNKPANDTREANSTTTAKKQQNRCRSFHFRYLELCRSKNVTPLPEIKSKNNSTTILDIFGDKISVNDWLIIVEALYYDQVLQTLGIRTRKSLGTILDHLDTEKKAKLFRQKPAIYTKFVFSGIVEAIANSITCNSNLKSLYLEGLPLSDNYVDTIAKALSSNESLKEVSFQRSSLYDAGCKTICNTMKYLENIEKLNLSECGITTNGAIAVAEMIKMQKISRYTEGWQKSLRYRDVDPNSIPGLRIIELSHNPQIDDEGVKAICEVLIEDVWIKVIHMENCGLTDRGANCILDCLEVNRHISDFNVSGNTGISKFLHRNIQEQLGKEDEEQKAIEERQQLLNGVTSANIANKKVAMSLLKERLKALEEQIAFERVLREKAETLNERLNQQIIAYENQLEAAANAYIPEGYVVVKNESLQSLIQERKDLLEQLALFNAEKEQISNTARTLRHQIGEVDEEPLDAISVVNICDEYVKDHEQVEEQRKFTKVRKVKSEVKYMEPAAKVPTQKREPKSDHEFYSEAEFQQYTELLFESNIGDSLVNNAAITQRSTPRTHRVDKKSVRYASGNGVSCGAGTSSGGSGNGDCGGGDIASEQKQQSSRTNGYIGNFARHMYNTQDADVITMANNFDMDDLVLESTRTRASEVGSTDSDTIRNPLEKQPLQVLIKPKSGKRKSKTNQQKYCDSMEQPVCTATTSKDKLEALQQSPRSLFFGLNDD